MLPVVPIKPFYSLPRIARYLVTSALPSPPRQGTLIAEIIKEASEDQGLEGGETEWEEENKENEEDHESEHFAEADSEFEVDPDSEARWRLILDQDLKRDREENRKPLLPRTDGEFTHRYLELKISICDWAFKYFSSHQDETYDAVNLWKHSELLSYIKSILLAEGPNPLWDDVTKNLRPNLVMGVFMKVIQIHIFGLELFGASEDQLKILRSADRLRTERDPECIHSFLLQPAWSLFPLIPLLAPLPTIFKRQEIRAGIINSFYPSPKDLPNTLQPNVLKVMDGLVFLLTPLLPHPAVQTKRYIHSLTYLLIDAARLHFDMRREPDTIYYVYSPIPGDSIDDHTLLDVPRLPIYNQHEREDPEQRIHIAVAPGIMALRKRYSFSSWYQIRSVADAIIVA